VTKYKRKGEGAKLGRHTSLALDGPQLLPDKSGRRVDMSEILNSLPAEGGDRRTFREALHFLAVEIEVRRVALLPDVNATRLDLEPLRFVQTAGDEREDVTGYGVEEDVGVSGGADADVGARWGLHGSLEGRAEARRG
jgi:hypothetical protein